MRLRFPTEITILWLNEWRYYAGLAWTAPNLIQLQVGWGRDGAEAIVRLLGFGFRVKIERRE